MIVKDLFTLCDTDKLMACLVEKYQGTCDEVITTELVAARYLPVLDELATITPASDWMHFVLGVREEHGVEVMEFYAPTAKKLVRFLAGLQNLTEEDFCQHPETMHQALLMCDGVCFSFAYTPWAEVLGMEVYAENIRHIGAEAMAASILYEMTEVGCTAAEVDAEINRIQNLLDQTEYRSINEFLIHILAQNIPEEKLQHNGLLFYRNWWHLLMKYEDVWNH